MLSPLNGQLGGSSGNGFWRVSSTLFCAFYQWLRRYLVLSLSFYATVLFHSCLDRSTVVCGARRDLVSRTNVPNGSGLCGTCIAICLLLSRPFATRQRS